MVMYHLLIFSLAFFCIRRYWVGTVSGSFTCRGVTFEVAQAWWCMIRHHHYFSYATLQPALMTTINSNHQYLPVYQYSIHYILISLEIFVFGIVVAVL